MAVSVSVYQIGWDENTTMLQTSNGTSRGASQTDTLSEGERHKLFAADERRFVLDALAERESPVDLSELAEAVAVRMGRTDGEDVDAMKVLLHHVHLPKMVDAGVLEYDTASHVVGHWSQS